MYIFPTMLDTLGFPDGQPYDWKSQDHRRVAQNVLLCNPRVNSRDKLIDNVKIINQIPQDKIRSIRLEDLIQLGVTICAN